MAELTDDRLVDLFADLRAGELHRVRPPGAAASRSTVRRRRVARSVTIGVSAMASITAAGMAGILPVGGPWREAHHVPLSPAALTAYQNAAAARIGVNPLAQVKRELSGQVPMTTGHRESHPAIAGVYTITMSCVGTGTVAVTFSEPEDPDGKGSRPDGTRLIDNAVVPCRASAQTQAMAVTVTRNDRLYVDMAPDREATGAAGFAYTAVLAQESREKLRLSAARTLEDDGAVSYFLDGSVESVLPPLASDQYWLLIVCLGAGSVNIEVKRPLSGSRTASVSEDVTCRRPAHVASLYLGTEKSTSTLPTVVTVVPNRAATRQAAVAVAAAAS